MIIIFTSNDIFEIPKFIIPASAIIQKTPSNSATQTFTINAGENVTGSLIAVVDAKSRYTQNLANGSATINIINLASGTHRIILIYSGDANYSSVSKTFTINIPKATTPKIVKLKCKITASSKSFKAKVKSKKYTITLKAGSKAVKSVKVTLKVKGKTYTAKTNSNGKATFTIKNLNKKGKYSATIKFDGDSTYKSTSKTVKLNIKK